MPQKHYQKMRRSHLRPGRYLLLLIVSFGFISSLHAETVDVCDDENLWPPYTITKDGKVTGAMVEMTDAIFSKIEIPHSLHLTPWKRCLYQVENFSGEPPFEVFINGTFSEERAQKYLVSETIYSTGNAFFYSNQKFKQRPEINSLADLQRFSVCGVHGYNYEMYKIKSEQLKVTANDLHSAFRLLKSGRCEIILNAYSVPFGSLFTDTPMIDDTVSAEIFSELPVQTFHMFVSRKSPRAEYLINAINDSIRELKSSGVAETIFKKYLPDCGTDC